MNNLLYKLTLCKGEPEESTVYAYLSDNTVKLIEEELSGTKTTNMGHTFVDVANNEYDIGIVDDISCAKDNEYDKWLGEDVSFSVVCSPLKKEAAYLIYEKLRQKGEEVIFNRVTNTIKLSGVDFPTALNLLRETRHTLLNINSNDFIDNKTKLLVFAETYQEQVVGVINSKDDVWKLKPVPEIYNLEDNVDRDFLKSAIDSLENNRHNTIDKFALLETVVNMKMKHYLNDFYYHDVQILSYPEEDKYLLIVRENGTHLVPKSDVPTSPVVEFYVTPDKKTDYLFYELNTNAKSLNLGMINPVLISNIDKYINECKREAQEKALLEEVMNDIDYEY